MIQDTITRVNRSEIQYLTAETGLFEEDQQTEAFLCRRWHSQFCQFSSENCNFGADSTSQRPACLESQVKLHHRHQHEHQHQHQQLLERKHFTSRCNEPNTHLTKLCFYPVSDREETDQTQHSRRLILTLLLQGLRSKIICTAFRVLLSAQLSTPIVLKFSPSELVEKLLYSEI